MKVYNLFSPIKKNLVLLSLLLFTNVFLSQSTDLVGKKAETIIKNSSLVRIQKGRKIPIFIQFQKDKEPTIEVFFLI